MWKSSEMDGSAVGMRTVSSATRKMLSVSAEKHSSVANDGRELEEIVDNKVSSTVGNVVVVDVLIGRAVPDPLSPLLFAFLSNAFGERLEVLL
jgi:hypothetical protein